jgi:phage-related baseplate assembly protein
MSIKKVTQHPTQNEELIFDLSKMREADCIEKFYKDYVCTENLAEIWGNDLAVAGSNGNKAETLFSL